jgi:O-antigen/teichoic acid export membrane protein
MNQTETGSEIQTAARRVARNTLARAASEFVAKFASLALMTVLSRKTGASGLGVFVFALAWAEITLGPIDMGFDRYFLRRVATDRGELSLYLPNVLALKLWRTIPVLAVSWGLLWAIGYPGHTRLATILMTLSFVLDGLNLSFFAAFNGVERGDLIGAILAIQRLLAAAVGVALLLTGHGVVAVALVYVGASAVAVVLASVLLTRKLGRPPWQRSLAVRRDLRRNSVAFAGQDLLSSGIAKLDTVLLSLFATSAVVGYYGAAYRLLEATLFVPAALQGAYAAMYTYLHHGSAPTIRAAFQRSIKMLVVVLAPATVLLLTLPGSVLKLLFGHGFGPAIGPLRFLALAIVPLGLVMLCSSFISARLNPRLLVIYFAVALVINVVVNLALIPTLDQTGAAIAMLATEVVLAVLMLRPSLREARGMDLVPTAAATLVAAGAMAVAMALLHTVVPAAIGGGAVVYVSVLLLLERRFAPADYAYVVDDVRRRLRLRPRAAAPAP